MAIIISPIRRLAKSVFDLGGKIVSGGFAWFGSKKVSDTLEELEKEYFPPEDAKPKPTKKRQKKSEPCDDRR